MLTQHVNYLAVLIAAISGMAVRYFWYAPAMFRESWLTIIGMNKCDTAALESMRKASRSHPTYLFVASFITAAVMDRVIGWLGASNAGAGILVGFWAWLGLALPVTVNDILLSGRENCHMWQLFLIQSSQHFFALLLMGGILGVWR